ncbi:MAG: PQQ-binding-like beta-propeller repeat protein, partial [Phycisphaerales bacterium]|nr:PQQ-binding-like beta-propeller repeat protein [Phycisphaerales bacterium]
MNSSKFRFHIVVASLILGVTAQFGFGGDWPNFLGPHHDGISDETGFIKSTTEPLRLIWDREIGSAFSSFAIADHRLFTCGQEGKQQNLYCLNADTGEVIWKKPLEKEFRNEHGDGTRATPTVHDGLVYILGAHGRILCADAKTGEMVWEKQFSNAPTWAYSGSVLIEGDLAIASGGKGDG